MRHRLPLAAVSLLLALTLVAAACSDDDGATAREGGGVVSIVGPPPPEGGGSVSATGSGCTTSGATTKVPKASVEVGLDEYTIAAPDSIAAGVTRIVLKNFGSEPHGLLITEGAAVDEITLPDGSLDEAALEDRLTKRVEEFAANTICEGTFELPAGTYVLVDPAHIGRGMVTTLTVS